MDVGHIPHVVPNLVQFSLENVLLGKLLLACGFVPEADVKMGIKELLVESSLGRLTRFGGLQYVSRLQLAAIEVVNLHHGDPAVVANREEILAGFGDRSEEHTSELQ